MSAEVSTSSLSARGTQFKGSRENARDIPPPTGRCCASDECEVSATTFLRLTRAGGFNSDSILTVFFARALNGAFIVGSHEDGRRTSVLDADR